MTSQQGWPQWLQVDSEEPARTGGGSAESVIDFAKRAGSTHLRQSIPTITPLRLASPAKEDLRPGFGWAGCRSYRVCADVEELTDSVGSRRQRQAIGMTVILRRQDE